MALSEDVIRDISTAEDVLKKQAASLKKILAALSAARLKVGQKAWPVRDLKKLLADLNSQKTEATEGAVAPLIDKLEQFLNAAEAELEKAFVADLVNAARQLDIDCGLSSGVRFIGPFELVSNFVRESVTLSYAKQPASGLLPLEGKTVADAASKLAAALLKPPTDPLRLAVEFEEAHKVALIRDRKPVDGRETRSMLPELFREMQYVRQDHSRPLTSETLQAYSLARFVVELKMLVQSASNLDSTKRFRLETAVIENTKNARKSVFVPNDLKVGYGEGTYFQALLLVNENR
jgi:hypothetical protein